MSPQLLFTRLENHRWLQTADSDHYKEWQSSVVTDPIILTWGTNSSVTVLSPLLTTKLVS